MWTTKLTLLLAVGALHPFVERLLELVPLNPPVVKENPYHQKDIVVRGELGICGIKVFDNDTYLLASFLDEGEALSSGYAVTHHNQCGACSTLQDFAVYLSYPDLTTPVRWCALYQVIGASDSSYECIRALGFSEPCARIWNYNAENTRDECFWTCLEALIVGRPNNDPITGELNPCIACDEERSGPIFKQAAGRTRRNSGLVSAIRRSDDEVVELFHEYLEDLIY